MPSRVFFHEITQLFSELVSNFYIHNILQNDLYSSLQQRTGFSWFYHLVVSFDVPYIRQTGIFLRIDVNNTTEYTTEMDVLLLPPSPNYSAFLKNRDSI